MGGGTTHASVIPPAKTRRANDPADFEQIEANKDGIKGRILQAADQFGGGEERCA